MAILVDQKPTTGEASRPEGLVARSSRLWRTNPLVYVTLVAALILAVFPLPKPRVRQRYATP